MVMFMLITVLRSIRSDYAAEIWSGLLGEKVATPPQVFTTSEIVVALMVMVANGLCFLIKDNRRAFFAGLAIGGFGTALIVASVAGLHYGLLDGFAFMVLVGIGLYLPYVAIHTTIFERLIAMTRDRGNLGYLMYLADSFGYLGYPVFMLFGKPWFGRSDALNLFVSLRRPAWSWPCFPWHASSWPRYTSATSVRRRPAKRWFPRRPKRLSRLRFRRSRSSR